MLTHELRQAYQMGSAESRRRTAGEPDVDLNQLVELLLLARATHVAGEHASGLKYLDHLAKMVDSLTGALSKRSKTKTLFLFFFALLVCLDIQHHLAAERRILCIAHDPGFLEESVELGILPLSTLERMRYVR